MIKKLLAAATLAGVAFAIAAPAVADPPKICAPGQHPAPQPGFKPGSCDKKK